MAHFNFVISQNAKWGHAGFYIDCHRMTVPENILLQEKHWFIGLIRNHWESNTTHNVKCRSLYTMLVIMN